MLAPRYIDQSATFKLSDLSFAARSSAKDIAAVAIRDKPLADLINRGLESTVISGHSSSPAESDPLSIRRHKRPLCGFRS